MFNLTKQTIGCIVWVDEQLCPVLGYRGLYHKDGAYARRQRARNIVLSALIGEMITQGKSNPKCPCFTGGRLNELAN